MKSKIEDETALVPPPSKKSRRSLATVSDSSKSKPKPVADSVSASSTSSLSSLRGEDLLMTSTATMSSRDQPDYVETLMAAGLAVPSPTKTRRKRELLVPQRKGRWTMDEKLLFLYGLCKFGKGRWKKISVYLPDRSLVQIKSHAQKVLKRLSEGENVFQRLEQQDSIARLQMLLSMLNEPFDPHVATNPLSDLASLLSKKKRKRHDAPIDGREHILAASALCQLATPAVEEPNTIIEEALQLQPQPQPSLQQLQLDASNAALQAQLLGLASTRPSTSVLSLAHTTLPGQQQQQQQLLLAHNLQAAQQQHQFLNNVLSVQQQVNALINGSNNNTSTQPPAANGNAYR